MSNAYEFPETISSDKCILYFMQSKTKIQKSIELSVTNGLGYTTSMPRLKLTNMEENLCKRLIEVFGNAREREDGLHKHLEELGKRS